MESSPETPDKTQGSPKSKQVEPGTKTKSKQYPGITMYSTTWCGVCKEAKSWLKSNRVPFKEYDIESSKEYLREYKELGGGGVPLIMIGNEKMSGWSEGRMRELLGMSD